MSRNTDGIRQNTTSGHEVDDFDRKLLGVLVDDATVSYAELGQRVGLSAPAVHERVKRLRRSGAIRRTSVSIDPGAVGKPLRAGSTQALESLLAHLYATPGVTATRSYVALSTQLERPVQPGVTSSWQVPERLLRASE